MAFFSDIVRVEDGTQRFLATTLGGNVHVLNSRGQLLSSVETPLLNAAQTGNTALFNQRFGLNSFALHPDFNNLGTFGYGKAYGVASQQTNGTAELGSFGNSHDSVLFEYDLSQIVDDSSQNVVTNSSAPRELLRIRQTGPSHNGFDLAFREDGQLYYSVGDGTANSLADDNGLRLQLAQDLDSVYGKLLRINPDPTAFTAANGLGEVSANGQYSISNTNPFFNDTARSGNDALSEIYANGFRSPFRISVNPNNEDEVFLGDVGDGSREEVNRVVAGGNYGWGIREGSVGANNGGLISVVTDGSSTLFGPELEYGRSNISGTSLGQAGGGRAVIGGFLYEGTLFDDLTGQYIGAELGNFFNNGSLSRVFFGDIDDDLSDASTEPAALMLDPYSDVFDNTSLGAQNLPNLITGLIEGFNGEIFVIGLDGTATPGVDEGPGEFNEGNLVIVRLTPEGAPDLDVDGDDLVILVGAYGVDDGGDLNSDGDTNGDDFLIWQRKFTGPNGSAVSSARAVPEPNASILLALGGLVYFALRK